MGRRPFEGKDRKQIRDEMLSREVKIPEGFKGLSELGRNFINAVCVLLER
jgi:hypothetical protein